METLYMETTNKSAEQTISEIQMLLRSFGLSRFNMVYGENGKIEAVYFTIKINGNEIPYRLPVNHKPLLELANQRKTRYIKPDDEDQAIRVAWRQVYRWIEAQLALIRIRMVDIQEVFLPYMMANNKQTIYEKMLNTGFSGFLLKE